MKIAIREWKIRQSRPVAVRIEIFIIRLQIQYLKLRRRILLWRVAGSRR